MSAGQTPRPSLTAGPRPLPELGRRLFDPNVSASRQHFVSRACGASRDVNVTGVGRVRLPDGDGDGAEVEVVEVLGLCAACR